MAKGLKTGGRQKGTSNKLSGTVKEMITQFATDELQHLPSLLNQLQAKERAELLVKLIPFILPKAINQNEEEKYSSEKRSAFVNGIVEKIIESNLLN